MLSLSSLWSRWGKVNKRREGGNAAEGRAKTSRKDTASNQHAREKGRWSAGRASELGSRTREVAGNGCLCVRNEVGLWVVCVLASEAVRIRLGFVLIHSRSGMAPMELWGGVPCIPVGPGHWHNPLAADARPRAFASLPEIASPQRATHRHPQAPTLTVRSLAGPLFLPVALLSKKVASAPPALLALWSPAPKNQDHAVTQALEASRFPFRFSLR